MARLEDLSETMAGHLRDLDCSPPGETPVASGPALSQRRVAIISTAGLTRRGDRPFGMGAADYRVIPTDAADDLVVTHLSTNFDRTGFQQDMNVMFPLQRLQEMDNAGEIGSVADFHYTFMGASDPATMKDRQTRLRGCSRRIKLTPSCWCLSDHFVRAQLACSPTILKPQVFRPPASV